MSRSEGAPTWFEILALLAVYLLGAVVVVALILASTGGEQALEGIVQMIGGER